MRLCVTMKPLKQRVVHVYLIIMSNIINPISPHILILLPVFQRFVHSVNLQSEKGRNSIQIDTVLIIQDYGIVLHSCERL